MPELPEVETVRAGAEPHLVGRRLDLVELARHDLRWPIPVEALVAMQGRRCLAVMRRSKFLLLCFGGAGRPLALVHLGMTGRLCVEPRRRAEPPPWRKHEHWRMHFGTRLVRYVDPRRFGALGAADAATLPLHPWLRDLGQEPLEPGFDGDFLHRISRRKKCSIKALLMNARLVVGIGNIYASESCWRAAVRPRRAAGSLSRGECQVLATAVVEVLRAAIAAGGTSFRDFVGVGEDAGYFARELDVYERMGEPCHRCGALIRRTVDQGRSSYWCAGCQR
ncbi:MAG: bifunctional DNA-formamidopyrimidine glycosylase/DNA-(apurinic or apyrimidinic site) lyase [Planctomycetes bacterium]|nr:bifunctional DNA-formamidopyrimidine glycosylase/DNA-(apurinic or apyrimidinic site) lyase [Planctomycetota bacterium]